MHACSSLHSCISVLLAVVLVSACSSARPSSRYSRLIDSVASDGFTNFETEPVQPLALSPDGHFLYALNTADDRLEIFDARGPRLRSIGETTVGLRPVAIALRGDQAWITNHLSDSVSVVDVSQPSRPRVIHTLQVGDEPRGIVVAGPTRDRVFVASAYRGETLTPGIGRAQLWIFDAGRIEAPPKVVTLFGSKPRALAASSDGRKVYAAAYLSGNGTTTVSGEDAVRLGRAPQLYLDNIHYSAVPKQGPIVRRVGGQWRDDVNRDWSAAVPFELPDYDVFAIDAAADDPAVVESISGVGTVLFNMAVQPGSGEIWVSNTEAFNFVPHEPRLQGKFAQNRVSRILFGAGAGNDAFRSRTTEDTKNGKGNFAARVQAIDLNPHITRSAGAGSAEARELSLAQPLDLVFHPDGSRAYVAAFGSSKVGVLDHEGKIIDRIAVGFGPGGLALDARRERLYVLNHLDATISLIDLRTRRAFATTRLRHDPTPAIVRAGRPFLYDAAATSRHGDLSCATCHVFADADGLAWDLGDPAGPRLDFPVKLKNSGPLEPRQSLHPLKGPMVTQSLRGLASTAPFHWRGDRFGAADAPGEDIASFKDFNPAFVDLLGQAEPIADGAMEALARFVLTIRYPPNPNQRLDRLMDAEQKAGFEFFTGPFLSASAVENCVGCHSLPAGTNRLVNFEHTHVGRDMKTAHLRNVYDKIGRFNAPGPQISGFGLIHDGTFDTVLNFLRMDGFEFPGKNEGEKDVIRRQLHQYIMAFDTGMAPAVGRQVTVGGELRTEDREMLRLLEIRSAAGECDLTARGWEGKAQRGWLYGDYVYHGDRRGEPPMEMDDLLGRFRASGEPVTFTCVPPGDGIRSALDRDLDGVLDGDE
jgi:YVTN family beta-propeller protein